MPKKQPPKNSVTRGASFPRKLFAMLEDAEPMGFSDIVTWQPDGNSFKVNKPKKFEATIMQHYFNQTKYKSFQRQLNIYGFQRIHVGPNKGGYEHPCLSKNSPELCDVITRHAPNAETQNTIKNSAVRLSKGLQRTPLSQNFIACLSDNGLSSSLPLSPCSQETDKEATHMATLKATHPTYQKEYGKSPGKNVIDAAQLPTSPCVVNSFPLTFQSSISPLSVVVSDDTLPEVASADDVLKTPQDIAELDFLPQSTGSHDDFFGLDDLFQMSPTHGDNTFEMDPYLAKVMDEIEDEDMLFGMVDDDEIVDDQGLGNGSSEQHNFPRKLHLMLEDAEKNGFSNIVSWVQEGAAFKVHDSQQFVEKIMPSYFDQTKYESFRRQLNLYGFSRVSRGENRGIYFHEFFLESDRRLCRNITRGSK